MESKDVQPLVGYLTTYGAHGLVEVSSLEALQVDKLKGELAKIWHACYWLERLELTPTGKPGVWGSVIKDDDKPKVVAAWPKIVSAAMRWPDKDNLIICSPRHFDTTCHAIMRAAGVTKIGAEQGFIDQLGQFYNREQAWFLHVEMSACKVNPRGGAPGKLYSEHLY